MGINEIDKGQLCNYIGSRGEFLVASEFVRVGYQIYFPIGGKAACDFLAANNDGFIRVEVKSTTSCKSYDKKTITPAYTTHGRIGQYDKFDVLAFYIIPLDVICYFSSYELANYWGKRIRLRSRAEVIELGYHHKTTKYVEDYLDLSRALRTIRKEHESKQNTS